MDLVLHIGCEKTGTTSLQFWLDRHSETLADRGIVYSRALGRPNNRRISYYGLEPGTRDEGLRREGVLSAERHATLQGDIARDLEAEVAAARQAGCATFLISNEHCHSRLRTETSVARVRDLLAPLFERVRVVCVLRPQMDACLSLASTLSRNGAVMSRDWIERQMRPGNLYFALDALLQRWADAFGAGCVEPVAFRRHPDAIGFMEGLLGVAGESLARGAPANEALDYRVMAIVNAMHEPGPGHNDGDLGARFFINELPVEQRLTLDLAWAQALQGRFAGRNAALCAAWPDIEEADLVPEWGRYPERGNVDRLDMVAEVGPYVRRIIDRLRGEAVFERAMRFAAACERDLALQRPGAALEACRTALGLARQAVGIAAHRRRMEALIGHLEARERQIGARE